MIVFVPGLSPASALSKLIHAQRCLCWYIIHTAIFLMPSCGLLPAHQPINAIHVKPPRFPTFSLLVGFYLCNQGFQREKASLEGSIMKRGSVCPAAWNSKRMEASSVCGKSRSWEDRGNTATCKCRSGLKSTWAQQWNSLMNWFQQSSWGVSNPEKAGCSLRDLSKSFLAELLKEQLKTYFIKDHEFSADGSHTETSEPCNSPTQNQISLHLS